LTTVITAASNILILIRKLNFLFFQTFSNSERKTWALAMLL
jgi:hypothetical protein